MICYKDTTFCLSPNCACGRALTREIERDAQRWWNETGGRGGVPISGSYFCGQPEKEAK